MHEHRVIVDVEVLPCRSLTDLPALNEAKRSLRRGSLRRTLRATHRKRRRAPMDINSRFPCSAGFSWISMDARRRTGGRRGIRTHGGPEDLNSFRDCPIRPLWQPSTFKVSGEISRAESACEYPSLISTPPRTFCSSRRCCEPTIRMHSVKESRSGDSDTISASTDHSQQPAATGTEPAPRFHRRRCCPARQPCHDGLSRHRRSAAGRRCLQRMGSSD
jgi:hypothetical protein